MKALKAKLPIILFMLSSPLSYSQSWQADLNRELSALAKKQQIVGFAAAIVDQNHLVYTQAFGYADRKKKIPYTINTLQPIASLSKTVIGVALMKAQELGKLNLDDAINKYLPFTITNPYHPTATITIRQLAAHTSTLKEPEYLRSYIFEAPLPEFYKDFRDEKLKQEAMADCKERMAYATSEQDRVSISEFIRERFTPAGKYYRDDNFTDRLPGEAYYYSNEGAALAAYIIESATGMSYTDFTRQYIFAPLHMQTTTWDHMSLTKPADKNRSKLYYYGQDIPRFENITYPDGELVTNIAEFSRYMSAMISGYNGTDNILQAASYREMMAKPADSTHEAVFWEVDNKFPGYIGYSGADMGILTIGHFYKEQGTGVLLFANTSDLTGIGNEFLQLYFVLKKYAGQLHPVANKQ